MSNFNEAEHPRDDIGRFTYKNGGAGSSSSGIIQGRTEKIVYPDDRDSSEGGWKGIGDVLGGVFGTLLSPPVIASILSILAAKYSVSELKRIKDELYEHMERNSNSEQSSQELSDDKFEKMKQAITAQQQEQENKIQQRADILYGSDEEYYKKFPHRNYPQSGGNITGSAADSNPSSDNNT